MRLVRCLPALSLLVLLVPACGGSGGGGGGPAGPVVAMAFQHRVLPDNWVLRGASASPIGTAFDQPATNGRPDRIVHVNGGYDAGPITPSVAYDAELERWGVVYPPAAIGNSAKWLHTYEVLVRDAGPNDFVHTAALATTSGNWTSVAHPLLDGNPLAIMLVTARDTPAGPGKNVGVFYDTGTGLWGIFTEDVSIMPIGAAFNVSLLNDDPGAFLHVTQAGNTTGGFSLVSSPLLNGRPDAIALATHVWNPLGAATGAGNDVPIHISAEPDVLIFEPEDWRGGIRNQPSSVPLPLGTGFNIVVR